MNTEHKIKRCVGAVIYNDKREIFLMTSGKWHGRYVVPGGTVEPHESDEEALIREIREEMDIELSDIQMIGTQTKSAGKDFIDEDIEFHFIDFIARAETTDVTPNDEIDTYDWFDPQYALDHLDLIDSTRKFIQHYLTLISKED